MGELYEKLKRNKESDIYPFHMPGHKRQVLSSNILESIRSIDITEVDGFDNLHNPKDVLKRLNDRGAKLWGSDESFVLVNGSSCGILAALCSQTEIGSSVIIARNSHKSAYNALVINNLKPVYLYPFEQKRPRICLGIDPLCVEAAIDKNPDAKVVFVTSPTYEGVISDIKSISKICHKKGVILIVDEAHGAHLGYEKDLIEKYGMDSAINCGADIVIQSLHKTLPSFTQTAILHVRKGHVDIDKLRLFLTIFQSSSPSYIFMSGVERCFDILEDSGQELFSDYKNLLEGFYKEAELKLHNLNVLSPDRIICNKCAGYDIGKIVICCSNTSINGEQLYETLLNKYHLQMEMCSADYVIAMTSIMDSKEGIERLLDALIDIDDSLFDDKKRTIETISALPVATIKEGIRDTLDLVGDAVEEQISIYDSEGRISTRFIYAYPPGVPVIVPGEMLTSKIISYIVEMEKQQVVFNGLDEDRIWVKNKKEN